VLGLGEARHSSPAVALEVALEAVLREVLRTVLKEILRLVLRAALRGIRALSQQEAQQVALTLP